MLGTRRTGESVNKVPWPRRRLAIEFGEPLVIERAPGMSGKVAIEAANEAIRIALAQLVDGAVARTGLALPTDDPKRERSRDARVACRMDPSLYAGSAAYYPMGRMPYPAALADALRDALGLDGTGRLLDVGCGPGSLTLLLAPLVGVRRWASTPTPTCSPRLAAPRRAMASRRGAQLRAEELPADLGTFRLVTFAQSFHWMDQPLVADRVRGMLEPGGAWVHVSATTAPRRAGATRSDAPPWDRDRRARRPRTSDPCGGPGDGPARRDARGRGGRHARRRLPRPQRIVEIPRGELFERSTDAVVAAVFSLSSAGAAPLRRPARSVRGRPAHVAARRRPSGRSPSARGHRARIWPP